jgi:hypothetical protein
MLDQSSLTSARHPSDARRALDSSASTSLVWQSVTSAN